MTATTPRQIGEKAESPAVRAFRSAMAALAESDPPAFSERLEELAFLTNAVLTLNGQGRATDVAEAVVKKCAQGFACVGPRALESHPLDVLYRIGQG